MPSTKLDDDQIVAVMLAKMQREGYWLAAPAHNRTDENDAHYASTDPLSAPPCVALDGDQDAIDLTTRIRQLFAGYVNPRLDGSGGRWDALGDRVIRSFVRDLEQYEQDFQAMPQSERTPAALNAFTVKYLRVIEATVALTTGHHLGLPFQQLVRSLQNAYAEHSDPDDWFRARAGALLEYACEECLASQEDWKQRIAFVMSRAGLKSNRNSRGEGGVYSGESVRDWRQKGKEGTFGAAQFHYDATLAWLRSSASDPSDALVKIAAECESYLGLRPEIKESRSRVR